MQIAHDRETTLWGMTNGVLSLEKASGCKVDIERVVQAKQIDEGAKPKPTPRPSPRDVLNQSSTRFASLACSVGISAHGSGSNWIMIYQFKQKLKYDCEVTFNVQDDMVL